MIDPRYAELFDVLYGAEKSFDFTGFAFYAEKGQIRASRSAGGAIVLMRGACSMLQAAVEKAVTSKLKTDLSLVTHKVEDLIYALNDAKLELAAAEEGD